MPIINRISLKEHEQNSMLKINNDQCILGINNDIIVFSTREYFVAFTRFPFTNDFDWKNSQRAMVTFGSMKMSQKIEFNILCSDIYTTAPAWNSEPFRKGGYNLLSSQPYVEVTMDDELILSLYLTPFSDLVLKIRDRDGNRDPLYLHVENVE